MGSFSYLLANISVVYVLPPGRSITIPCIDSALTTEVGEYFAKTTITRVTNHYSSNGVFTGCYPFSVIKISHQVCVCYINNCFIAPVYNDFIVTRMILLIHCNRNRHQNVAFIKLDNWPGPERFIFV